MAQPPGGGAPGGPGGPGGLPGGGSASGHLYGKLVDSAGKGIGRASVLILKVTVDGRDLEVVNRRGRAKRSRAHQCRHPESHIDYDTAHVDGIQFSRPRRR